MEDEEMEKVENEIVSIIRSNEKPKEIREKLEDYHESDIANTLHLLTPEERKKLYAILEKEKVSEIFTYLDDVDEYINELEDETAADLIELMDADDALDVLQELDDEDKKSIVSLMDKEAVEDVKLLSSFDDNQIGSKMTTNYIIVKRNNTVKEAMKHLIKYSEENDNIQTLFVKDENGKFYGSIELTDLIRARDTTPLEDIIHTSYPYVHSTETIEDCINDLRDAALNLYPVLNENDELTGVITQDDLVEVVHEEMAEDYAKLAGLSEAEELDESVGKSVKKRIVWLIILLLVGMVVSIITSNFEHVFVVLPGIVAYQSVILDMSGNAGTQSLGITLRAITDDELPKKKVAKMVLKEVCVGIVNATILAFITTAVVFGFIILRHSIHPDTFQIISDVEFSIKDALLVSTCVGGALIPALTLSTLCGCLVPLVFKALHMDSAIASGPLITTINDIVGILTYYGLAMVMFNSFLFG